MKEGNIFVPFTEFNLPTAWQCNILFLPSDIVSPRAEGGVINLGAWRSAHSVSKWYKIRIKNVVYKYFAFLMTWVSGFDSHQSINELCL